MCGTLHISLRQCVHANAHLCLYANINAPLKGNAANVRSSRILLYVVLRTALELEEMANSAQFPLWTAAGFSREIMVKHMLDSWQGVSYLLDLVASRLEHVRSI
jgi:hypothetical protein